MLKRIVSEFQAQNPKISLNAVISRASEYDVYTHENFPRLLGKDGFDVVEVDTLLLKHLVDNNLIVPIKTSTEEFWPASIEAVSYEGKTYGVPSWMCMEFLFARNEQIKNIHTLQGLIAYLNSLSPDKARLVGVFNGIWTIGPQYLNAYTHLFGYDGLEKAPYNTPVYKAVENFAHLTDLCDYNKENKCTNSYYGGLEEGEVPKLFAQNNSHAYIGFSENSFYIRLFDNKPFYAVPVPFGKEVNTLTYTDAYVANASRCSNSNCLSALKVFADYMNRLETRRWIAYSEDLAAGMPPRRSLPAIKKFYNNMESDKSEGIYDEFAKIAPMVRATPYVSKARRIEVHNEICKTIKTIAPTYKCEINAPPQQYTDIGANHHDEL